ncbi:MULTISPECIES: hypothetical protein [Rhodopseudomonas]|uniref:hypothetical protein n=1 Tax=Rhodopseudomonas TaxID=1073 RepID=UPI0005C90823|nr:MULTISPECIES: hypothetical protein [Rhodopseudomonas]MDF3812759.1 hypothetical protein [Rhodopseudomonas sp. BAL398]WOK20354.1 hypothetical protein RBJ75_12900 [Rhodopseudomonas sp. BAL398]
MSQDQNKQFDGGHDQNVGPVSPDHAAGKPVQATGAVSMEEDASGLIPDHGAASAAKTDAAKADAPASSIASSASSSRNITIMSPTQRGSWERTNWTDDHVAPERDAERAAPKSGLFGKRRLAALAAVLALATIAGAVGGALATVGFSRAGADAGTSTIQTKAFDEQMARIEAEMAALKTSVEHSTKLSAAQLGKTGDRLDKIEKAQAEPAAKLAKLTETVDKLRAAQASVVASAPAATPTPSAAKDVTGSIPTPAPKPVVSRLPTVSGWILRDVVDGGALIEGRQGVFEVYAGDPIPGLGRVDAVRRQDGRWVVVTSRGLIVAR